MKEKILLKLDEIIEADAQNCYYWRKKSKEAEKSGDVEEAKKCLQFAHEAEVEALTICSIQRVIEALYEEEKNANEKTN